MIAFLEGILEQSSPTRAILNVSGVGYDISVPISSYERLPKPGERCRILTYVVYREDSQTLYGFMTEGERSTFKLLLNVKGIGPKIALSALSGLSPRDLTNAILEGDVKRISSISGIGKKTAELVIVQLRDKIDPADALAAKSLDPDSGAPGDGKLRDAVLALVSLGYKQVDAAKMVKAVKEKHDTSEMSVEDLLKLSLTS